MKSIVKRKFNKDPDHIKPKMESLHALIYEVAVSADGVGELEEILNWGEPAYLTSQIKSGVTIRIDWKPKNPDKFAMFVNCNTNLISTYKALFGDEFGFERRRAILLPIDQHLSC